MNAPASQPVAILADGIPSRRPRWKSWWMRIHLYGGLACFWYLLVFSITTLRFNHPGLLPERRGPATQWERASGIPNLPDDHKLGEAVRDDLDLIGWVLPWNLQKTPSGDLRFELVRPGRNYRVTTDRAGGRVSVEERATGVGSAINFMHGSTEGVPGSRFLQLWGLYTDLTTGLVLFLSVSGVVLWWRRARDRRLAAVVVVLGLLVSAALMLRVWIFG
ncbi:MAG: PepSY-associated TM helix domain-containing protein [Verrucomicrobiota bacterium]